MRKLSLTIMLLAGLFAATGCDELEEVTIQLGGPPAGYYSHDYQDDYYYEEVVYEETYYEDTYYEDSWYYDDWSTGWFDWGW